MSSFDVPNQQLVQQERLCYRVVLQMTAKSHPTARRHPIATLNKDTQKNKKGTIRLCRGVVKLKGTRFSLAQVTQSNVKRAHCV